ncbi:putative cation chloride cotransporter [Talaromyces proteolyticus]|uniref:Cation chloride cotransporter n=1 Tax=Talaromyces proteolyticus TaxID=1131652 RepID=A0AAD4KKM4_9EURO|nr:putative cation chloride cotransporter [Talaromyces proteolyticus]KAH8693673.1 putative cation chloride cotransporter [Talaromyces proteolyticus]
MAPVGTESSSRVSESRQRPIFSTRSATEDATRLAPSELSRDPYEPVTTASNSNSRHYAKTHGFVKRIFSRLFGSQDQQDPGPASQDQTMAGDTLVEVERDTKRDRVRSQRTATSLSVHSDKLGTFSGVFVPTTLNVLSILMFLRFGFILGQGGVLGMMGMLIAAYIINLLTTMSISAIATNGTVRGGGAYYLISRSLGPEFGGSIGLVFYMGFVFNTGMNAIGLIDCVIENFGLESGSWSNLLQEGFWWKYLWSTLVLLLCTAICMAGSSIFSRASNGLLAILLISTFSIPFSALFQRPFSSPRLGVEFTGFRAKTFLENLKPHLTKGAAGSEMSRRETFQDLFGILFPATGGIFAGASMSGDLKNPSKSIPKGTLSGLLLTFITYTIVILSMAASITRQSFYNNVNVIQVTNLSGLVVLLGEFASTFFSSLMGVIGSAKLLQAIARDNLVPGLGIFSQGNKKSDDPTYAILFTYVVAQVTMLFDINQIASFTTMTYLMTFLATNLACFLLKIGSAPNFRPSFHYFNWQTAAVGAVFSVAFMFFVDGVYATGCIIVLLFLFVLIHYTSPPKSWGDVSQSLIYHQVRKYLLRLRQEHVKFWRPQILLFVNDLESQYKMIHFCNSLKKGALFVLGHVIVTDDFTGAVPEVRRRQTAWTKFIEYSKVKAFTSITVAPTPEWGVRNIVLNSGLGGMRPNIVIIDQHRPHQSLAEVLNPKRGRRSSQSADIIFHGRGSDNSDSTSSHPQTSMTAKAYLTILEDLLFKLRINFAVARGFENLELPNPKGENQKTFIDLWPIQMSAELAADRESKQNVLTTNFDTYTLILQLGCILNTVASWKRSYKLRVSVFVEYESDVEEERGRVSALLEKLRIEAEVLVFALANEDLKTYQTIVNGETSLVDDSVVEDVNDVLENETWWAEIQEYRDRAREPQSSRQASRQSGERQRWPSTLFQQSGHRQALPQFEGIQRLVRAGKGQRRKSISSFRGMNVNLGMQTSRLLDSLVDYRSDESEDSVSSGDSDFEPYVSDGDDDDDGSTTPRSKFAAPESVNDLESTQSTPRANTTLDDQIGTGTRVADTTPSRPKASRVASSNRFTSTPIPETRVNPTEGIGPSIMFSDSPPAGRPLSSSSDPESPTSSTSTLSPRRESIYTHSRANPLHQTQTLSPTEGSSPASGYPRQAAVPLSFNDLPCRAQHLILNELMTRQSADTAVMFTTLPSPVEGTCLDESGSEEYVSDLEILCRRLPPCLLVHSNSMTVTMNL